MERDMVQVQLNLGTERTSQSSLMQEGNWLQERWRQKVDVIAFLKLKSIRHG